MSLVFVSYCNNGPPDLAKQASFLMVAVIMLTNHRARSVITNTSHHSSNASFKFQKKRMVGMSLSY